MGVTLQALCIDLVSTGAGTDEERYAAWPFKGEWQIEEVYFGPATATSSHATNYTTVTVSTNDGAGGAYTSIGSIDTDSGNDNWSPAVDTSQEITVSGSALQIQQGYMIKLAKADSGTGAVLDGALTVLARKVT